jgi:hypothetical protein
MLTLQVCKSNKTSSGNGGIFRQGKQNFRGSNTKQELFLIVISVDLLIRVQQNLIRGEILRPPDGSVSQNSDLQQLNRRYNVYKSIGEHR